MSFGQTVCHCGSVLVCKRNLVFQCEWIAFGYKTSVNWIWVFPQVGNSPFGEANQTCWWITYSKSRFCSVSVRIQFFIDSWPTKRPFWMSSNLAFIAEQLTTALSCSAQKYVGRCVYKKTKVSWTCLLGWFEEKSARNHGYVSSNKILMDPAIPSGRKWVWGMIYYPLEGDLYLLRQWPWIHTEYALKPNSVRERATCWRLFPWFAKDDHKAKGST